MRRARDSREVNGWWVVTGGSVLLLVQFGLITGAFGAYLVVITDDTGWSPVLVTLGYAIVQLGNGFIAPLTGWCCDRFGTRAVARAGSLLTAAGFALAGAAADPAHFLGGVVVVALGCSAAGIMPLSVAVVQVLPERRTLALGLLPSGIALGGLAVPLVALALENLGWRATFLGVAGAVLAIGLTVSAVLPGRLAPAASPAPARAGSADGAAAPSTRTSTGLSRSPGEARPAGADPDLREAVRTSTFWVLVLGHGGALVAVSAINLHLVPLLTLDRGVSLAAAGLAVAAMALTQLLGQIVSGLIGDRVDKRHLAAGCMLVQCAVLLVMANTSSTPILVGAAAVHGLVWGLRGPAMTAMRADYFGLTSFGIIMGWSMGLATLGQVAGPLLVTALASGPGGYPMALDALLVVSAASAVMFVVLRRPPAREAPGEVGPTAGPRRDRHDVGATTTEPQPACRQVLRRTDSA